MTAKIIAENILDADDFLSATEQDGERIGQPMPGTNTGAFRLLSKGDIADFSYSGTVTGDGAAGGTTVIDSVLNIFGDDYFIGGTVAIDDFILSNEAAYFTKDDGPGRIALTDDNTVTVTDIDLDEQVQLYLDCGAAHFSDDFECHLRTQYTADSNNSDMCGVWALTNDVASGGIQAIDAASGDYLAINWLHSAGLDKLQLRADNSGTEQSDQSVDLEISTNYYLKVVRDKSIGDYGTLYCYIYTGSIDGVLVDTLTLTLTKKIYFRYYFWIIGWFEGGMGGRAWSGIIADHKIISSESKAISDFAQSTGTITTAAFSYPVCIGTTFTLTVPFATRDYHIELIASGDPGDATFKWSHDGGTTFLGRDDPDQANWLGEKTVTAYASLTRGCEIVQAGNGDLVAIYKDFYCRISSDGGVTWGAEITIGASILVCATALSSGRILVCTQDSTIFYSDDNGATWSLGNTTPAIIGDIVEHQSGNLLAVNRDGAIVYLYVSADGGFTWSAAITIASDANTQTKATICVLNNGNIVCAYSTDEDALNDYEIKCKISSNGGATWGAAIAVANFGALDLDAPKIIADINGDLYCAFVENTGDIRIVYTMSSDNGATWGAQTVLKSSAGADLWNPSLTVFDGNQILCLYIDETNGNLHLVRRGIWEAYAANACPCAIDATEQKLICDVGIVWHGGAGIDGDTWTFEPEYVYSMANLVEDSPSKPWRSEQDNIECNIVIDMGANNRLYADGVGFFDANFRQLNFQMHTADSWALPTIPDVWERVDFNIDGRDGGVYVTAGATASIIIADDPDIDFATGNFTVRAVRTLSTWKPTANLILVQKLTGGVGYQLEVVATTGIIRLTLNATVYNSSIAPTATAGAKGAVAAFVTVGAVNTTVDFSFNGVALGTQQTAANPGTVSNAAALYLMGTSAVRTAGIDGGNTLYNRALTHAQLWTQYETGEVADADQWGSQTTKVSNDEVTVDTTGWTGGNYTISRVDSNADPGAPSGGTDDWVLKCLATAASGREAKVSILNTVVGQIIEIGVRYYIPTGDPGFYITFGSQNNVHATGTILTGDTTTKDAWIFFKVRFTSTQSGTVILYLGQLSAGGAIGDLCYIDSVGVIFCGATLDLEAKTLNDSTWPDMSTNELTATLPAVGAYQNGDVCGTIASVAGNVLGVTYLELAPKDHELKGRYFRATSGTDKGTVWKISDNMAGYIYLDTTAAHNLAAAGYFGIFQSHISKTFTAGIKRYLRINIPAQETVDGFYQLGMMVAGRAISLDKEWGPGYRKRNQYDIEMLRTPHGGMIPVKGAQRKRVFGLAWPTSEAARLEVVALTDYIEGRNLCFIPDSDDMTDCYLTKQIGDIEQTHRARNYFDFTISLEEIL